MAHSPVDIITEVLNDLSVAEEFIAPEYDYKREGDRIAVRPYNEDGTLGDIAGYLTFEEK